jgi:hypothetical protein
MLHLLTLRPVPVFSKRVLSGLFPKNSYVSSVSD